VAHGGEYRKKWIKAYGTDRDPRPNAKTASKQEEIKTKTRQVGERAVKQAERADHNNS
jgi:hypothetical protein